MKKPMNAVVLCDYSKTYSCPSKTLCTNCVGTMSCKNNPKVPCFPGDDFNSKTPQMRDEFFEFMFQNLKFETFDPEAFKWKILKFSRYSIGHIFKGFTQSVRSFAISVCEYITPHNSYINTDITLQLQMYERFKATNSFRFVKKDNVTSEVRLPVDYLYIPDNFEEVFKQINISTEGINDELQQINEKIQYIDLLKYSRPGKASVYEFVDVYHKKLKDMSTEVDLILINEEKTERFLYITQSLQDFKKDLTFDSDIFLHTVENEFEVIYTNLINSIVDNQVRIFSQSLVKLNTWLDDNLQDLQNDTKTLSFFRTLHKTLDQYFSYSNAYMIHSWFIFHRRRVPHDWQARLINYGRLQQHWLGASIDQTNMTLSVFFDSLDFNLQGSYELFVDTIDLYILSALNHDHSIIDTEKIERLIHTKNNCTQFFEEWKKIIGFRPRSFMELLQTKFKTFQWNFRNSVKGAALFTRENLDFIQHKLELHQLDDLDYNHKKVQSIYSQLQLHAQPVFKEFVRKSMDRIIQNIIRHETANLDSTLDRLSNILIDELKLQNKEIGLWHTSQPYKKMIALKYSLETYEDFFRETQVLFDSNDLDIPREELEFLETVKIKFEIMQKQVKLAMIEERIDTRWNWGRNFVSDEVNIKNSGVRLRSTINFHVSNVRSTLEDASFSSLGVELLIFLFWVVVILAKMMKLNLKFR
jgi:hypothetical protein